MAVIRRPVDGEETNMIVRVTGAFIAAFSLAMAPIVLFVPQYSLLGAIELVFLAFLFIGGVITFIVGLCMPGRTTK